MSELAAQTSVLIPAYNEAHSVADLVEGLTAQGPWHEIIVIDDGSTDDTAVRAGQAVAGKATTRTMIAKCLNMECLLVIGLT